jgi:hypothetical protein
MVLAATAALAACGAPETPGDGDREQGLAASVADPGSGTTVALPRGFGVFPGAQVINATTLDQGGQRGTMLVMQSEAGPQAMVDHYREQAAAAGVEIAVELDTNGALTIAGESPAGVSMNFTATPQDGNTNAMLTILEPLPPPLV